MIQFKKIALAAGVAIALGVVTNVNAKGGNDSVRDKAERKALQDMEQLAKGGHDSARDKAERKLAENLHQRVTGATNSTRDRTERA